SGAEPLIETFINDREISWIVGADSDGFGSRVIGRLSCRHSLLRIPPARAHHSKLLLPSRLLPFRSRVPPPLRTERLTEQGVLEHRAYPAKHAAPGQDRAEGAAERRADTRRQP